MGPPSLLQDERVDSGRGGEVLLLALHHLLVLPLLKLELFARVDVEGEAAFAERVFSNQRQVVCLGSEQNRSERVHF